MQSLADLCSETSLSMDDARLILADVRPDWIETNTVTDAEANLIRQSARSVMSESDGEITPVTGMDLEQQERLVNNASQVLGFPLALTITQELEMTKALAFAKNQAILNILDKAQSDLNCELMVRSQSQQQAFIAVIQEIADSLENPTLNPTSVVEQMTLEMSATNTQIEALLKNIKSKTGVSPAPQNVSTA